MSPRERRSIRLVAAAACLAVYSLVRVGLPADGASTTVAVPKVSVPVRVAAATRTAGPERAPLVAQQPSEPAPAPQQDEAAHEPRAEPPDPLASPGSPANAPEQPDPAPSELIREVHVLYYSHNSSSGGGGNGSPCPQATTCSSYQLSRHRWPTDGTGRAVIPFAYNDEGRRRARAPDGLLRPALQAAMSQWSARNSNIVFQDTGTTTAKFGARGKDGSCDDGTNVVTWEKFGKEVVGAAAMCFDPSGRKLRDADLALNATHHWEQISGQPQSRHSFDIQSILTHELGHWLALEDLYPANASRQTMSGNTKYGETRKRTLALGDVLGIQKAYSCGKGDTCPRTGIAND